MESTTTTNNQLELNLHSVDKNEFIGMIDVPENVTAKKINPEMVVIIDRSGSMLDAVRRLTNEILPSFLSKLSYDKTKIVHLVYFHSEAESFSLRVEDVENLSMCSEGKTMMSQGIMTCQKVFSKFEKKTHKPIRLLTISDGEVQDGEETGKAAAEFAGYLKEHGFAINSQAVRLFTNESQPDTTALCSLLQVNNTTKPRMIDIKTSDSNESIVSKMANLFMLDNLSGGQSLKCDSEVIYKFPWLPSPSSRLLLVPGKNVFWLKVVPATGYIKVLGTPVKVTKKGSLSLDGFHGLIESQLFHIVDHMKILKVVGTKEASGTIQHIVSYFQETEEKLAQKSLAMKLFNIRSNNKTISSVLIRLAEDGSVHKLNLAERAAYLRDDRLVKNQFNWIKGMASDFKDEFHFTTFRYSFFALFAGAAAFVALKMLRH